MNGRFPSRHVPCWSHLCLFWIRCWCVSFILLSRGSHAFTITTSTQTKSSAQSMKNGVCLCRRQHGRHYAVEADGDTEMYEDSERDMQRMEEPVTTAVVQTSDISTPPGCVIKVLGVGGGGGNAVNRMIETRTVDGVSFWAINTDAQALNKALAPNILNIGASSTRGLGAGGNPQVGQQAAMENKAELRRICEGADMVFITAGMGGGTGSGAAPVVADIAKSECGCLTVGVVTKPFAFEGRNRLKQAKAAIRELRKNVDTLIVVSNDKLLQIVPENTPVTDAFLVADDILRQGVVGISEIILKAGLVNVDFADVRAVMKDAGTALMGIGSATGRTRAADAAVAAISSPLLDSPIQRAKRIVFNIVGGQDMGLKEINEASEVIYANADEDANIIFGALIDPEMGDEISITVLACDFGGDTSVDEFIDDVDEGVDADDSSADDTQISLSRGSHAAESSEKKGKKGIRRFLSKIVRRSK